MADVVVGHVRVAFARVAALEDSVAETISAEARLQHLCITSEDAAEGAVAFLNKRDPVWKGR